MVSLYVLIDPHTFEIRYVGVTGNKLGRRLSGHVRNANACKRTHTHNWILSLRPAKPAIIELEQCATYKDAHRAEIAYIAYFKTLNFRLTNHTSGGEGTPGLISARRGVPLSLTTRMKISQALLGHSYNKDIPKTPEHRRKLSKSKQGRRHTEEHSRAISEAHLRSGLRPPSWLGKCHSQETRAKMTKSAKTPARPVLEQTTGTRFPSIKAAARAFNLRACDISSIVNGRRGTIGGLRFKCFDADGGY